MCLYRGDLSQLQFTTQFIKETMRMHSPVPIIGRQVSNEFELHGITLKPGTFVDMMIFLSNHNQDVWGPDHYVSDLNQSRLNTYVRFFIWSYSRSFYSPALCSLNLIHYPGVQTRKVRSRTGAADGSVCIHSFLCRTPVS